MGPIQADRVHVCDVVYAHGTSQIVTGLRAWRGVVTATLAGAPPVSWPEHHIVLAAPAGQFNITRGEGLTF